MGTLQFKKVTESVETCDFDCGVETINDYVKKSYFPFIIQHAYAYSVMANELVLGYYQVLFRDIELDNFPNYFTEYDSGIKNKITAVHIRYIAIDKKYQRQKIGTNVLRVIIEKCIKLAEDWPIRVITIDAIDNLIKWYSKLGFKELQKNTTGQNGLTTAMFFDCMKHSDELAEYESNPFSSWKE